MGGWPGGGAAGRGAVVCGRGEGGGPMRARISRDAKGLARRLRRARGFCGSISGGGAAGGAQLPDCESLYVADRCVLVERGVRS